MEDITAWIGDNIGRLKSFLATPWSKVYQGLPEAEQQRLHNQLARMELTQCQLFSYMEILKERIANF